MARPPEQRVRGLDGARGQGLGDPVRHPERGGIPRRHGGSALDEQAGGAPLREGRGVVERGAAADHRTVARRCRRRRRAAPARPRGRRCSRPSAAASRRARPRTARRRRHRPPPARRSSCAMSGRWPGQSVATCSSERPPCPGRGPLTRAGWSARSTARASTSPVRAAATARLDRAVRAVGGHRHPWERFCPRGPACGRGGSGAGPATGIGWPVVTPGSRATTPAPSTSGVGCGCLRARDRPHPPRSVGGRSSAASSPRSP